MFFVHFGHIFHGPFLVENATWWWFFTTHLKKICVDQSNWIMNPKENRSDFFFQNIGGLTTLWTVWMDHLVGG